MMPGKRKENSEIPRQEKGEIRRLGDRSSADCVAKPQRCARAFGARGGEGMKVRHSQAGLGRTKSRWGAVSGDGGDRSSM